MTDFRPGARAAPVALAMGVGLAAAGPSAAAPADVQIFAYQANGDAIIDYEGDVDLDTLDGVTVDRSRKVGGNFDQGKLMNVEGEVLRLEWEKSTDAFGDGRTMHDVEAEGDRFGLNRNHMFLDADAEDGDFSGSMVFANTTIGDLGMARGRYTWMLSNGEEVEFNIGRQAQAAAVAAPVPVPASLPLMAGGLGLAGLAALRRRGRRGA